MKVSLCFFVWNELPGCKLDIPNIDLNQFDEVFAVDAGSTDGTVEYLESFNIPVHTQPRRGYNQAYIFAFDICSTDALIFYHPKGTIPPQHIGHFIPYLKEGYDLVIGSRIGSLARNEEDDKVIRHRKWFVLFLAYISAILWRKNGSFIKDVLHGFRAMRKDSFLRLNLLEDGMTADLEMVVGSYKRQYKVIEFPTQEEKCVYRNSHFKAIPTGIRMLSFLRRELCKND